MPREEPDAAGEERSLAVLVRDRVCGYIPISFKYILIGDDHSLHFGWVTKKPVGMA